MVSNKLNIEEIFPNVHFRGVAYSTPVRKSVGSPHTSCAISTQSSSAHVKERDQSRLRRIPKPASTGVENDVLWGLFLFVTHSFLPTDAQPTFTFTNHTPLTCDTVRGTTGHIVVVVSPLVNLMKGQATKLASIGIPAVTLSDISEENMNVVERGAFSVVYGSPEAWLKIDR